MHEVIERHSQTLKFLQRSTANTPINCCDTKSVVLQSYLTIACYGYSGCSSDWSPHFCQIYEYALFVHRVPVVTKTLIQSRQTLFRSERISQEATFIMLDQQADYHVTVSIMFFWVLFGCCVSAKGAAGWKVN